MAHVAGQANQVAGQATKMGPKRGYSSYTTHAEFNIENDLKTMNSQTLHIRQSMGLT